MGRGRAKAKQTKVARALKYGGPQTDFDRLQAELANSPSHVHEEFVDDIDPGEDPYVDDPYAKYYEDDDSEESDEDDSSK